MGFVIGGLVWAQNKSVFCNALKRNTNCFAQATGERVVKSPEFARTPSFTATSDDDAIFSRTLKSGMDTVNVPSFFKPKG